MIISFSNITNLDEFKKTREYFLSNIEENKIHIIIYKITTKMMYTKNYIYPSPIQVKELCITYVGFYLSFDKLLIYP